MIFFFFIWWHGYVLYIKFHLSYNCDLCVCVCVCVCYGLPGGSDGKESVGNVGDPSLIPVSEDPLEKELETHSNSLA